MSNDPSTSENDADLSALGRELLGTSGSKPSGPWVPPTAEELGRLLTDYEIVKMLGRGGMGAVYMGRQKSLDRPVAIKILSTALEDADPSFAERFKNEARAMGKLNHPGIVAVHDFGEAEGGLLYIVMEYVEGTDVARMIAKEGRLHTEHAMAITAHVCDALAYAHERGIIHRDIKPANIMVGYDGVVKVADFGLAKMTHSQNTGLTQSGMAMGTLHYMAPEALMLGSAVDHRADIYAVGVMLYQMLTGRIPQGMFELPSLQVKGLDPRYDGIIAKALREDREARYQSIREMRRDLDGILTQPVAKVEPEIAQAPAALPTQARPQRPGGQPYRPPQSVVQHRPAKKASSAWLVWATLGLLALGGGYWVLDKSASQSGPLNGSEAEIASHGLPGGRAERGNPLSGTKGPAVTNPPTTTAQGTVRTTLGNAASTPPAALSSTPAASAPVASAKPGRIDGLVANGEWQDVLTRLGKDPKDKAGHWAYKEGVLKCLTPDRKGATVSIPAPFWDTYSARLRFNSTGHHNVTLFLPTSHAGFNFTLSQRAKTAGIGVSGNIIHRTDMKLSVEDGKAHELIVEVSPRLLRAALDGHEFYRLADPDWKKITQVPGFPATDEMALGIGVAFGTAEFQTFEIRSLLPTDTAGTVSASRHSSSFDLLQHPEFGIRVANYQKARHTQLAELTAKYRSALSAEKDSATKSGVLGSVTAAEAAIVAASAYAQAIEAQSNATAVVPLPALSAVADPAPPRLKELRNIFVREAAKIENTLLNGLDSSLATVQASLVQSDKPIEARAVEDYRKSLLAAFRTDTATPNASISKTKADTTTNPAEATKDRPFVNSLGMKFVPVPGTKVLMCIHETRKRDYAAYDKARPVENSEWRTPFPEGYALEAPDDHPVVKVSWLESVAFADWLTEREAVRYRLPTDDEWSKSVGDDEFPWGNQWPPTRAIGNYADEGTVGRIKGPYGHIAAYFDDFVLTAPVMSFPANNLGIHDLGGNVWEWCDTPSPKRPAEKILRGSAWNRSARGDLASSIRTEQPPGDRFNVYGFRVVLEIPATAVQPSSSVSTPTPKPLSTAPSLPVSSSPSSATRDRPFVNTLGMKFVPVLGTKVLMCIHETRNADYAQFAADSRSAGQGWKSAAYQAMPVAAQDDHPVVMVSWEESVEFCQWITKKTRITHRLPTDREWSQAVGIAEREDPNRTPDELKNLVAGVWPYGMQYPPAPGAGNYADMSFGKQFPGERILPGYEDTFPTTAPVMSFQPNVLGIYDLGGNVWEWCHDSYNQGHPSAVIRGAAFNDAAELWMRSSHRGARRKDQPQSTIGFRVVLELP